MADGSKFEFGEILRDTRRLIDDLRSAAMQAEDTRAAGLVNDLGEIRLAGATPDTPPLSIAFVGQYNAGKSTILRVLTGRQDIAIDADVCTASVTAYDWNGVRLLDTPGIHAGYPDHDAATRAAIDQAELLVFVITNELFDDTIARHFRDLAFARQHAREMLLVVNKMGQDPGTPEAKRADIESVTSPLSAEDFGTVFVDARSWLDAQVTRDERDRAELLELANITGLVEALNAFVADRGLAGRLAAPLVAMRGMAEQGRAWLSADCPEERAALELLHRKRSLVLASRARLRGAMNGIVARAVSDIGKLGDEVAESIEPGRTERDVEALHADAQRKASGRSEVLSAEARRCVEGELAELRSQLDALRDGVLARELRGRVARPAPGSPGDLVGEFRIPSWSAPPKEPLVADWPSRAKKIGQIANNLGSWAAKWAAGPMAEGVAFGSARASQLHELVYNIGKFFGAEFQPWRAVKVARAVGHAGRIVAAAGGVLAVVGQIAEDRQREQLRLRLRDLRDGVRAAYRDSAFWVQTAFWGQLDGFLSEFHDAELKALDEIARDLTGKRSKRGAGADAFDELARRAAALVDRVHAGSHAGEAAAASA